MTIFCVIINLLFCYFDHHTHTFNWAPKSVRCCSQSASLFHEGNRASADASWSRLSLKLALSVLIDDLTVSILFSVYAFTLAAEFIGFTLEKSKKYAKIGN